tara:strand:+ start:107 stop:472 length:366 start_codon:yes stop_codon:yes gene_type:complete
MEKKLLTISEAAKTIGLVDKKSKKPLNYILRFWEKKFPQINPIKLNGKRRFYTQNDVKIIKLIKFLLKDNKLTIEGAKKILNNKINPLDATKSSSIKDEYLRKIIKIKSNLILTKLKKLKK